MKTNETLLLTEARGAGLTKFSLVHVFVTPKDVTRGEMLCSVLHKLTKK